MTSAVPPHRPRGSGDGWVELADGRKFWGRAGAAGLLVVAPTGAVLLQHRVEWSHFGGTWGLPGGARNLGESALDGALREAREESAIDTGRLAPRFESVLDLGEWSYTTVAADAPAELPVRVADAESNALEWVPADEIAGFPLHPGLAASWPFLRRHLAARPALVVDMANVVGSRPDGWWRDRPGANARLLAEIAELALRGVRGGPAAEDSGDPVLRWWPELIAVVEGDARAVAPVVGVGLVEAPRDGDAAIVAEVEALFTAGRTSWVVTADRDLRERVVAAGGEVRGPGWLLEQLL